MYVESLGRLGSLERVLGVQGKFSVEKPALKIPLNIPPV